MALTIVWFLDVTYLYISLVAAITASVIHLIAAIIASIRIGRCEAIWIVVFLPIHTFISCVFYTIILALTVSYTYQYTGANPDDVVVYWGLGFGGLYVLL
jgi:cation transporter-like permease